MPALNERLDCLVNRPMHTPCRCLTSARDTRAAICQQVPMEKSFQSEEEPTAKRHNYVSVLLEEGAPPINPLTSCRRTRGARQKQSRGTALHRSHRRVCGQPTSGWLPVPTPGTQRLRLWPPAAQEASALREKDSSRRAVRDSNDKPLTVFNFLPFAYRTLIWPIL